MSHYQVPAASVAIMKDGHLVSTLGVGGMNGRHAGARSRACRRPSPPSASPSLSMPDGCRSPRRSAACWRGPSRALGHPLDPRFKAITIEQLLMHRAGLAREAAARRRRRATWPAASSISLATPLDNDPGGAMVYSNIGYITLGMVVEAVTGSDYERYCRDAALKPMQASGTIDPHCGSARRAAAGACRRSTTRASSRYSSRAPPASARWRGNGRRRAAAQAPMGSASSSDGPRKASS